MNYLPWYTFHASKHLRARLKPGMAVFEYGCGSSTLFFAQHCGEVQAVDHNTDWCAKVARRLGKTGLAHKVVLHSVQAERESELPKDPESPDSYYAVKYPGSQGQGQGQGVWFERYAKLIRDFPDEAFDVISVDGGARNACIKEAIPKLKPGGFLILDNSDRPRYMPGIALIPQNWERGDFAGRGSVNSWNPKEQRTKRWQTTIWKRPVI